MNPTTEIKTISVCKEGKNCPYLNGGSIFQILLKEEKQSLQQELNQTHQKPFKREQKEEEEKPAKKKGAPVGHRGKGRKRPERIDQYIDIWPTECDR